MTRTKKYYNISFLVISLLLTIGFVNAQVYNEGGDFSIDINDQSAKLVNDNINTEFEFTIKNLKNSIQKFDLNIPSQTGWDITSNYETLTLNPQEEEIIRILFSVNAEFDYSNNLVSPDAIKIIKKDKYKGFFEFPVEVKGDVEDFQIKFNIEIFEKSDLPTSYNIKFSTDKLSPVAPLRYSVDAKNVIDSQNVQIKIEVDNLILNDFKTNFSEKNNFRLFEESIPNTINPENHDFRITIRVPKNEGVVSEWSSEANLEVIEYKYINVEKTLKENFFKDTVYISVENQGNYKAPYIEIFELSFFDRLLLSSNTEYIKVDEGIEFNVNLEKGEKQEIYYSLNFLPLYLILLIVIIICSYIVIRKHSNPLNVETQIYEIKKITHEGVKSLKIKIGFENIKETKIDSLKIIFRMPSYLNVKENSFLLSEPNQVLKGKNQYKLVWNFKNFEQDDSRILGFALVNKRGILGDIKLPELELEVKSDGKTRNYYKSFQVIKG